MIRDIYFSRGCIATFCVVGMYWGAFGALVPDIKPMMGLSDGAFGTAMLVSTCGALMSMWLAPWAVRALGVACLPILSAVLATAYLTPGLAWNWGSFTAAMVLAAMASGVLDVAMNARLSVLEGQSGRALMSLNHGMFSVAYALAAIGTGLARGAGWSPFDVFATLGGVTVALMVVMVAAPRITARPATDAPGTGGALPWRLLIPAGVVVMIAFMAEQGTEGWSALHLERGLGASETGGSFGPAILGITMAIGRLSGHLIIQRFGDIRMLTLAAFIAAFGAGIAAWAPAISLAYLGFALLGLGVSVIVPIGFGLAGRAVDEETKALAISRVTAIGYAGFFLGPPMMGLLAQALGLPMAFTAVAVLLVMIPLGLAPLIRSRS
ncbi:MAG: MFS transporter [Pelagimonas sp.]|jgi:MFS family permease|nr:MFS transporter [Pelagimonas sp.]